MKASVHPRSCVVASRLDDLRGVVTLAKSDVELLHRVTAVLCRWAARDGLLERNLVPGSANAHFRGATLRPFHLDEVKPEQRKTFPFVSCVFSMDEGEHSFTSPRMDSVSLAVGCFLAWVFVKRRAALVTSSQPLLNINL